MKNYFFSIIISTCFVFGQTNAQINKAKEYVRQNNMSIEDVKKEASKRGISLENIENLRGENKSKLKGKESLNNIKEIINNDKKELKDDIDPEIPLIELDNDMTTKQKIVNDIKKETAYFGYDIFQNDPSIFQSSLVGAIDPNYLIGPGDELIVMLWGETQFRQVLSVDNEGFIFMPEIGQVFVNGLSLELLESKLFNVLSKSYASINPPNQKPTTFFDVSLGNLRPLRIQVLGEVAQPGAYIVNPSTTLFSSLYYFNGPTELGSLRDIRLIRGGEEITSIDFYDYLLTGKKLKDQKLQLDDIIFVPKRISKITIEGQVNRAGIYELKKEESLIDLFAIAGGLKADAYIERAQIDRIVSFKERASMGMDRMIKDVNISKVIDKELIISLQDEDIIEIFNISDFRENIVTLEGAVLRDGIYEIDTLNETVFSLIQKSGGVSGEAYLERAEIIRIMPDLSEEFIEINLQKILDRIDGFDVNLQNKDIVKVYSISEMVPHRYVTIQGHVKIPGRYKLRKNMTINDLVFLSGGILDLEFGAKVYFQRADLFRLDEYKINRTIIPFNLGEVMKNRNSDENLVLLPDDIIKVYSQDIFNNVYPVTIMGIVNNPGNYEYKQGMNLEDLILEAGGIIENLFSYKIEIARFFSEGSYEKRVSEIINFEMNTKSNIIDPVESGNNWRKFKLSPYDKISIRQDPKSNMQKSIKILGEVFYPGEYAISKEGETILDLIKRAGNLREKASKQGATLTRDNKTISIDLNKIFKNKKSVFNFVLQDNDVINIYKSLELIQIIGEVNAPGYYQFYKNMTVKSALRNSGGFTQDAEKTDIYITFPNGHSKKYGKWLRNHKVLDGSLIVVGKKADQEEFDSTEYFKELTSIIANLAQVVSLLIIAKG